MPTQHEAELHLALWCEIVGPLEGLHVDDYHVYVKIGDKMLPFTKGSKEAEIILEKLSQCPSGTKIGVLKTDISENPLLVLVIE